MKNTSKKSSGVCGSILIVLILGSLLAYISRILLIALGIVLLVAVIRVVGKYIINNQYVIAFVDELLYALKMDKSVGDDEMDDVEAAIEELYDEIACAKESGDVREDRNIQDGELLTQAGRASKNGANLPQKKNRMTEYQVERFAIACNASLEHEDEMERMKKDFDNID